MKDRILMAFAFVILLIFVGILGFSVPRLDLGLVIIVTMVLVVWDFFFRKPDH